MKAYKASYDGKCKTLNYEVGKTYTFNGKLKMCQQGFHFCKELKDVFTYYSGSDSKELIVFEIETLGKIITEEDKSVSNKIKILRILTKNEYEKFIPVNEYDQNNNVIHYKTSNGFEYWNEYDENNNMIHHKTSDGYEYWKEYDENNNLIYYKNSGNFEEWKEYDENNNMIHYKNSNGISWKIEIEK